MNHRLKIVYVSDELIGSLLFNDGPVPLVPARVIIEGLPQGCKVERVQYCPEKYAFAFVLSHDSFPEIPEGSEIQVARPIFKWVKDEPKRGREFL